MKYRDMHIHGGTAKEGLLDLSVNMNPLGVPGACTGEALLAPGMVDKYPEVDNEKLTEILSERCGNPVILGNGSCELIYAICHYMGHKHPGYSALIPVPTFGEYGHAVRASGGRVRIFKCDPDKDFTLADDLTSFAEEVSSLTGSAGDIKLVFLCNPNNPTGELIERARIEGLAEELERQGVTLVVDECFLAFTGRYEDESMTYVLKDHPNVIVLDSFTKLYSMPGLRIGYAVSSDEDMLAAVREGIQPWNVSGMACEAAIAALKEEEYSSDTPGYTGSLREMMIQGLRDLSLKVIGKPEACYVFFEGPAGLKEALNGEGIDIRDCLDMMEYFDTGKHYYRLGICKKTEIEAVLKAIGRHL